MDEESIRLRPDLPNPSVSVASGTIDRWREPAVRDRDESKELPAVEISRLRTEIDATRDQLGRYVSELDRRRHEALDLKYQAKKHPVLVIAAGVAVVGAVVMAIRARRNATGGRKRQRKPKRVASSPYTAPANPGWMLGLLLKAAMPIGIAVVTRLVSQGTNRRPRSA